MKATGKARQRIADQIPEDRVALSGRKEEAAESAQELQAQARALGQATAESAVAARKRSKAR